LPTHCEAIGEQQGRSDREDAGGAPGDSNTPDLVGSVTV
jgi:hypothetical protein